MSVTRIHEDPRVTKPYTEEEWRAWDWRWAGAIDEALDAGDVRLTMGGEPTFLSIDDRDGEEWNFLALGPTDGKLAGVLLRRLRDRFAPGTLLHFGQGKWYPGESLPRWALGCYWRRDGVAVWQDQGLIAEDGWDYRHGDAEARRFSAGLAGIPITRVRGLNQGVDTGLITVPSLLNRAGNFSDAASQLTGTVSGQYFANQLAGKLGYGVSAGEPYYQPGCVTSAQCVFPNGLSPATLGPARRKIC